MTKLLQDCSNDECKYVVRFLQKTLKTGAAQETVIAALARAFVYTPPNKPGLVNTRKKIGDNKFVVMCKAMEASIKQAFCEHSDYGEVCRQLLIIGDEHWKLKESCHIRVGIPVKPMLAKPTKGV